MIKISYIFDFNNADAKNAQLIGHKGANLTKLFNAKITVPTTYFITNKYFTDNDFILTEDFLKPIIKNLQKPWFIRSSCQEEDIIGKSNAGKFISIKADNITELIQGIKKIVNHAKGVGATPAIIIQAYIDGDYFGVTFTDYEYNENSNMGLIEFSTSHEGVTSGTNAVHRYVYPHNDKITELAPLNFLKDIYFSSKKIKAIFAQPQDIEFVVKNDTVYIVQTRALVSSANPSKWWYWTKRENTPLFPAQLRLFVSDKYVQKYNANNCAIMYCKNNLTHLYYNKSDIFKFQETWLETIFDRNIKNMENELKNSLYKLTKFSEKLSNKAKDKKTINKYFDKYVSLYSESVTLTNESFLGGFILDNYLRELLNLKCELLNKPQLKEELFEYLTTIKNRKAWVSKVKFELRKLKNKVGYEKTFENTSNFEKHLEKINLSADWIKIQKIYSWISYNWLGPGLNASNLFAIYNSEKKITTKHNKHRIKQATELLKLSEKEKYLFKLLGFLIYAKDWRNGMYSKASYYFNNWFKQAISDLNCNYDNTFYLSKTEIKELILTSKLPKDINLRKKDCLLLKEKNNNTQVYSNKDIPIIFKNLNLQNPNTSNNTELNGQITCAGLITGSVRLAKNGFPADLNKTDIIVISSFHPEDTGKLMTVGGIIVEEGGITSHISIIARELGIPCLINVKNATKILKENQKITLDANSGNIIK